MALTGKERSLTVQISLTIAGVLQPSYPHTYQGRNAFTWDGVDYPTISPCDMQMMSYADYATRLADFELYVQSIEVGLDISSVTVAGKEAYRDNITSCPIGTLI